MESLISPVNGLIVNWNSRKHPLSCECLPKPIPPKECVVKYEPPCIPPMQDCVDIQSWGEWLSEVIVGIENPNEDIAANYIRQTAIEFCKKAWVLQRVVTLCYEKDNEYVIPTWPEEQIWHPVAVGVSGIGCFRLDCCTEETLPIQFKWDLRNRKVQIMDRFRCIRNRHDEMVKVWVAVAPTEDSLYHDKYLYDMFRRPVSEQARAVYARAVHFRDTALMRNVQRPEVFDHDIRVARNAAIHVFSSKEINARKFNPL